ncbi:3979_t:CDS:2 [Paraglomus brasilianum]|uniref:3979_t:CDS:1 n=1 Tax=Paraglomus brasilianum TaxID=144538 RepID=A0A9N8VIE7_9GLOM|nr:3979_t:CDS:2 [Paraglomus brasilianum]
MTSVIYPETEASAIAWRSRGQIDLRKIGTYAMASLRFFQDVTLASRKAEGLTQEEDYWINSAYMGGLVWDEPYEGIATELDFNEFYPNILAYAGQGFRYNPAEYYSHYDLKLAMELDLHIELSSESPNALIYDQIYLKSGYNSFYQWASYLTKIKQEGGQAGKVAKHMLVSFWGRLYSDGRRLGHGTFYYSERAQNYIGEN